MFVRRRRYVLESLHLTILDPHSRIMAMSFQGREFTLEMKQLVINLKLHFDEERKNQQAVSTRNPTLRTAQALGIGEITVKRIMAEYRQHGDTLEVLINGVSLLETELGN